MNAPAVRSSAVSSRAVRIVAAVLMLAAGAWAGRTWEARRAMKAPEKAAAPEAPMSTAETATSPAIVHFDASRQAAANIRTATVEAVESQETITVTGKLAVDDDRLAHVYSQVEGVLREAPVKLGQDVKAGQTLAMVDSKEVGQAKLDLARNQLNLGFARTNHQWAETIHTNTQALIKALASNPPVSDLEKQFRDQPMGDNRQLLVAGYAKYEQTKADYERLHTLREQQVGVEKDYIRAKAEYESASATYQAVLEQLKFTTQQRLREADQKLQESLTAERMSRALLLILGYTEAEIAKMDPLAEGESVAHYPIRAPFDGTVIGKHAVLSEQVGPTHQLYEITDLSKVWLHADVFEKDLPALERVTGKRLEFTTAGYNDRRFTAEVAYTGDSVDEKTRAVRLIAIADNPERLLKPGMFVAVALPIGSKGTSVQIPSSAVQSQGTESYVFVASGADEFQKRVVRVGRTVGERVEVREGLRSGEKIVVEGGFALKSELMKDLLAE